MNTLDKVVEYILEDEGPEVNESPDEPGGISKYGVSLNALGDHYAARGLPRPSKDVVRNLTRDQAADFYRGEAEALRLNDLPPGVDYVVMNTAMTVGKAGAALVLQ